MTGTDLIRAERERQIEEEGWTPEHDDEHACGELIDAGLSYVYSAINPGHPAMRTPPSEWSWDAEWWKPTGDPIRDLTKAGALFAAEIDRLQRAAARGAQIDG